MTLTIILITILVFYLLLLLLYGNGWSNQKEFKLDPCFEPTTRISILIPARNEEAVIEECLQSILYNDYPRELIEIIVIDDFSEDRTTEFARRCLTCAADSVLELKDFLDPKARLNAYKKKALEIAIGQAKGELVITVDADCKAGPLWLKSLAAYYEQYGLKCIAGPVTFWDDGKAAPVLFLFQLLDFMTMQGITAASLNRKLGNMCNGANFAFEKTAFNAVDGYRGIDQIASGDDMLLMDKIAAAYPGKVAYLKCRAAIMQTRPQSSWRALLNQRVRWASKAGMYQEKRLNLILVLVYLFNLGLFLYFIYCLFNSRLWPWFMGIFMIKIIVEFLFLLPVAGFFNQRKYLTAFPFLQPFHVLYIICAGFLGKFGVYQWKGRVVK